MSSVVGTEAGIGSELGMGLLRSGGARLRRGVAGSGRGNELGRSS